MKLKADRMQPGPPARKRPIECDHDSLGTEYNPRTHIRTVRCKNCGFIMLQMTEKEFVDGFWDKELVALQPGIARGRGGNPDD